MIGLSRVTPRRWLLPPARGLAPASVVVVVARLKSRVAASRSAVSLAPTLTHALLPDVGSSGSRLSACKGVLGARPDHGCARGWP
jgi:hypothetical protein